MPAGWVRSWHFTGGVMANWLLLLGIVLAAAVLGWLVLIQFVPLGSRPSLETLFAGLTLGIVICGWLALLLAEVGLFSRSTLLVSWLAAALSRWIRRI